MLKPKYFFDENGRKIGSIPANIDDSFGNPSLATSAPGSYPNIDLAEAQNILAKINATKIKIADRSATTFLSSRDGFDYLKSELGINALLPYGTIDKLRYKISLFSEQSDDVWAEDGFPKNEIENKYVIGGKIKLGIDTDLRYIPILETLPVKPLLKIDLNPWDFSIGNIRKIKVAFSGGLTNEPEWLFSECGLENGKELRVALIIKKAKAINHIDAYVEAYWSYYDSWWLKLFKGTQLGIDKAKINIL